MRGHRANLFHVGAGAKVVHRDVWPVPTAFTPAAFAAATTAAAAATATAVQPSRPPSVRTSTAPFVPSAKQPIAEGACHVGRSGSKGFRIGSSNIRRHRRRQSSSFDPCCGGAADDTDDPNVGALGAVAGRRHPAARLLLLPARFTLLFHLPKAERRRRGGGDAGSRNACGVEGGVLVLQVDGLWTASHIDVGRRGAPRETAQSKSAPGRYDPLC